jgi:hypothetical protein
VPEPTTQYRSLSALLSSCWEVCLPNSWASSLILLFCWLFSFRNISAYFSNDSWVLRQFQWITQQIRSYSRTSEHFMETKGSLPYSKGPSNCPYPEPDQSSTYHSIVSLFKIYFNNIHTPTAWSSQWSLSFLLSHQYPIYIPLRPFVLHVLLISFSLTWSFYS